MRIVNHYQNENNTERITLLTCACLSAIRQSRSGEPVYIGKFFPGLTETPESETAG